LWFRASVVPIEKGAKRCPVQKNRAPLLEVHIWNGSFAVNALFANFFARIGVGSMTPAEAPDFIARHSPAET